jgi:hypothetical protein
MFILSNKIRDKGKTVPAWKRGCGGERREWGEGRGNDPIIVYTSYE